MRLIDGDALIEKFNEKVDMAECLIDARTAERFATFCALADAVEEMPTVDAVEVVHGRWEEMHYEGGILDGTNFDRCSVCGYERVFDDPALKTVFKYCPNCGARMDEVIE